MGYLLGFSVLWKKKQMPHFDNRIYFCFVKKSTFIISRMKKAIERSLGEPCVEGEEVFFCVMVWGWAFRAERT